MLDLGDENAIRGYQQIVETYRDNKQWQMATDVAAEAAKKFPNDRGLQMVSASQQADMGKADVAIEHVKTLLKGNADDREVYIALAQMYSRVKDWPAAEENINKAIDLASKPEDKDYAIFVQGSIYERQKKYDLAEEAFRKVLADDPKNAMALNYLGYMLADRDTRLEEALGYIRRAVALDPQNGAYLDSLGWAYYKLGQVRSGGREPAPRVRAHQHRSHRASASGRALPEDGTPEVGSEQLGALSGRVEQNDSRRSGPGRSRQGTEGAGDDSGKTGQTNGGDQTIISDEKKGAAEAAPFFVEAGSGGPVQLDSALPCRTLTPRSCSKPPTASGTHQKPCRARGGGRWWDFSSSPAA